MPYRIRGKSIQHLKAGRWITKQKCSSVANAKEALRLLNAIEHNPNFKPRG